MILVSILGDFHSSILPVSYEFKKEMSRHVILYDDSVHDIKKSWKMIRGQKAFLDTLPAGSPYLYELTTMQVDEDSYESIVNRFYDIQALSSEGEEIWLNTTDGLSSIAIVLSNLLLKAGGKVIAYDRFDNTYNLHTAEKMTKHSLRHNLDIATHLLLKGYTVLKATTQETLNSRKDVISELMQSVESYRQFIVGKYLKKTQKIPYETNITAILEKLEKQNDRTFQTATVFNEYIYHLLKQHFSVDDIKVDVHVKIEEDMQKKFDILMIKGNHLHLLDLQLGIGIKGENKIYHMEHMTDLLDEDGRAMVVSIGQNLSKKKQFSKGDKARAKLGDIAIYQKLHFNQREFLKMIQNTFLM